MSARQARAAKRRKATGSARCQHPATRVVHFTHRQHRARRQGLAYMRRCRICKAPRPMATEARR